MSRPSSAHPSRSTPRPAPLRWTAPLALAGLAAALSFGPWSPQSGALQAEVNPPLVPADPAVRASIGQLEQFSNAFSAVADAVRPSVVSIEAERTSSGDGVNSAFGHLFGIPSQPMPIQSGGSGILVSPDGFILTNNHVVEGADTITVHLADGRQLPAELKGADPKTDLAVLKVEATGLRAATLGDSDAVHVGEWVVAIGHPYNLQYTVTAGIVSAKGRGNLSAQVQYQDFIQTDASINPGNSGGPLVNLRGEVIGINTLIDGRGAGLGFSIPSNMAARVSHQLISSGRVVRPWLGVRLQDVDRSFADALGLDESAGAFIVAVEDGSPAARAGLEAEDVVVAIDGAPVTDANSLVNHVIEKEVGQKVALELYRDGKRRTFALVTGEQPADGPVPAAHTSGATSQPSRLGIELQGLTPTLAAQLGVPAEAGVVVLRTDPTGPAARAGLRRGDVIVEVNRAGVKAPEDVVKALETASGEAVLVKVLRGKNVTYVALPLP